MCTAPTIPDTTPRHDVRTHALHRLALHPRWHRHEGQRLSFMINDILDSSKLKAGKMKINMVPIDPHKEVEKVIMSLRQARDHSSGNALLAEEVTLRNDIDPALATIEVGAANSCRYSTRCTCVVVATLTQAAMNPHRASSCAGR